MNYKRVLDFKLKSCYIIYMRCLILLLLLAGCADTSSFNRTYPKRPEIVAAMTNLATLIPKCEFGNDTKINVVFDVDVGAVLDNGVLGHCIHTEVTKIRDVVISRRYYEQFKNTGFYLEMLLTHELGHCQYGLGHIQGTIMDQYADYIEYSDRGKIRLMKQFEESYCGK